MNNLVDEGKPKPHLLLTGDVADLGRGAVVIAGQAGSVRLAGEHAWSFASRLAGLADGTRTALDVLAALANLPSADVDRWLSELASAGLLVDVPGDVAAPHPDRAAGLGLASLGVDAKAFEMLRQATVVVVGLDAVTVATAGYLASYGIGNVVLATTDPEDHELASKATVSLARSGCAASRRDVDSRADLLPAGAPPPDFFVGSTAPGLIRRAHWANTLALELQIPAVFGSARGHTGLAGPLVFPGETPCLLCYRMRALACADDFEQAMALEEGEPPTTSARRPVLPHLADAVGGLMAFEAVKTMTAAAVPTLAGAVLELDGLEHSRRVHRVLQRHDCPGCRKKGRLLRRPAADGAVGLLEATDLLVSQHCGMVRVLEAVPVDVSEPARPFVVRAEVANNRFRDVQHQPFQTCSGKGMDRQRALVSTLGEACERYGATAWSAEWVQRRRIDELEGDVVSPADLVLFADDQYDELGFARFEPAAELGWITGRDMSTGARVNVPAVEALLGYEGSDADRLYPSTSNGLAAGTSFNHAVLGGALEVIERDAFLVSWFNRLGGSRVDPFSVENDTVRTLAEGYRRRCVSLELYRLPTDVAGTSVYVAIGVQTSDVAVGPGPAAVVGLGADLDDAAAAAKAVLEVGQVRPALKARLVEPLTRERRARLVADPAQVEQLDDHDLLYSHPDTLGWLSFWRDQDPTPWRPAGAATPVSSTDRLACLAGALADAGHRLVGCDLTPPELAVLGVHVARAVIPGFQPIHFGAKEARLGGPRLYDLPQQLGLRATRAARADLNPLPHPIS